MCGILAILDLDPARSDHPALRQQALSMARKIRHRGPDWSGIHADERAILVHERLSIVDVEHGAQPLVDTQRGTVLAVNGEIYNHRELRAGLREAHAFQTGSDCEVILYLYDEADPKDFLNRMNGIFAFVLWDPRRSTWLIARDPIGVVPLYLGWDREERLYVASEMKALVGVCERIREVPPGHFLLGREAAQGFQRYYEPAWADPDASPDAPYDPARANKASAAWGVETRVPFLDRAFLDVAMGMDPAVKLPRNAPRPRPIEKYPLRQAFDGFLPDDVLWRQKEQFSDGVGYAWIDRLKATAEDAVTDGMLRGAAERFPVKTPETKEAYLYRQLFETHFPSPTVVNCVPFERSVACSTATALAWDATFQASADPSGRAVADIHHDGRA